MLCLLGASRKGLCCQLVMERGQRGGIFIFVTDPPTADVPPGAGEPLAVIVNGGGGTASRLGDALQDKLAEAFAKAGVAAQVECVEGADIAETVRRAGAPTVVVGGGDGTLGTAAKELAESGRTLGILPLGTRNHLALQLGIPTDLDEAAAVIAAGHATKIDLGRAGDRIFVNNVSVGLYPRIVQAREHRRGAMPKWLATIPAVLAAMRRLEVEHFRMEWNGAEHKVATPLLFVGNNRYALDAGRLGQRESLTAGLLGVAAVAAPTRRGLIGTLLRLVVGRADPEQDFTSLEDVAEVCIYGHHIRRVALDGELARLRFPLKLASWPRALSVLVPATGAAQSTSHG